MHGCRLERHSEVLLIKRRTGRLRRPIAETVGIACLGDAARRARPLESAATVCDGGRESREGEMWDEGIPSSRSQGSGIYRVLDAWRRETRGYLHASHDSIALKPPRMGYVPFHGCLASSRFPTLPRNLRSASKQLWSVGCIRASRPLAHGWWPLQRSTRRTERFTREVTRVAVKIRPTGDEKKKRFS